MVSSDKTCQVVWQDEITPKDGIEQKEYTDADQDDACFFVFHCFLLKKGIVELACQYTDKKENSDQRIGKDMQADTQANIFFPPDHITQTCTQQKHPDKAK